MAEEKKEKASAGALIISFLFPIAGIYYYFTNKKEVENASAYLWATLAGFVVALILS